MQTSGYSNVASKVIFAKECPIFRGQQSGLQDPMATKVQPGYSGASAFASIQLMANRVKVLEEKIQGV